MKKPIPVVIGPGLRSGIADNSDSSGCLLEAFDFEGNNSSISGKLPEREVLAGYTVANMDQDSPTEQRPSNASHSSGLSASARLKLAAAFWVRLALTARVPARHCRIASSGTTCDSLDKGIASVMITSYELAVPNVMSSIYTRTKVRWSAVVDGHF